jgi:hypothetical protein
MIIGTPDIELACNGVREYIFGSGEIIGKS